MMTKRWLRWFFSGLYTKRRELNTHWHISWQDFSWSSFALIGPRDVWVKVSEVSAAVLFPVTKTHLGWNARTRNLPVQSRTKLKDLMVTKKNEREQSHRKQGHSTAQGIPVAIQQNAACSQLQKRNHCLHNSWEPAAVGPIAPNTLPPLLRKSKPRHMIYASADLFASLSSRWSS